MGSRSDWLYRLIFEEAARVWDEVVRHALRTGQPAPEYLLIRETAGARWDTGWCAGEVRRSWRYRNGHLEPCRADENPVESDVVHGHLYDVGAFAFHIAADRKRVLINYMLGPRYGRGNTYGVRGQGARGRLVDGEGAGWIS